MPAQPYVGQIILVGFSFVPQGWLACDGSLYAITGNETLFNLIGTTFGGDGQSTFAVPDLRGRVPLGMGQGLSNYSIGQSGGVETTTLTSQQIPPHTHPVDTTGVKPAVACKTGPGNSRSPVGAVPAGEATGVTMPYSSQPPNVIMGAPLAAGPAGQTAPAGGGQPHDNMQPYLVMQYVIAALGVFPSQT